MAEYVEQTASSKLAGFIERNKKGFITVLGLLICALIGYIVVISINNKIKDKDLQSIDEITNTLTSGSSALEDSEIELRRTVAIEQLSAFTSRNGIAGARANMLCADITFQQAKYEESAEFWKLAAKKAKKTYIAPLAYFNLGVCYEELGKIEDAASSYKLAAYNKEFVMRAHALFSYSRVMEELGDYANAALSYTDLNDNFPESEWASLAKSRLIALKNEGKIE